MDGITLELTRGKYLVLVQDGARIRRLRFDGNIDNNDSFYPSDAEVEKIEVTIREPVFVQKEADGSDRALETTLGQLTFEQKTGSRFGTLKVEVVLGALNFDPLIDGARVANPIKLRLRAHGFEYQKTKVGDHVVWSARSSEIEDLELVMELTSPSAVDPTPPVS